MIVYCPDRENACINALICAFSCPTSVKLKCSEYKKNYEKLKKLLIEQRYLDKYGLPSFPDPSVTRKVRQKKTTEPVKPVEKPVESPKSKPAAPKKKPVEVPISEVKTKRKRRTKKEMEEARRLGGL